MKVRLFLAAMLVCGVSASAQEHQPPGVHEALRDIASQQATRTSVTFDREMLDSARGYFGDGGSNALLDAITVENYRYREPAFYTPENFHALVKAYDRAGWKHLVDQNAGPAQNASPTKSLTDLWLHFRGAEIDDVTVLIRGPRQMSVIEVSGLLRPLDLVHLSGHFGIPKVDPNAVMVPAPPGR